jgi:protein ImuB
MRRVLSLWLPHWPTDRLIRAWRRQRAEQPPVGRPLVLVTPAQGAVRLTAVNAAAAAAGLAPSRTLADARALCPDLAVADAAPVADRRALAALADWCTRYSPWAAVDGDDGILVDLTGCAHLFGGEAALVADLARRLGEAGIAVRAAIAGSAAAAWGLARYAPRHQAVVPAGGDAAALAPLPAAALRLPAGLAGDLSRLGLATVGDLCPLPRAALGQRFGAVLAERLDLVLGRQTESLAPRRPAPAFLARAIFPEPIGRLEDLEAAADRLAKTLCRLLRQAGRGARRLQFRAYRCDGQVGAGTVITVGLARPSRTPAHLARLVRERLETLDLGFGADVLTLAAPRTEALADRQATLPALGAAAEHDPELALLLDRLANRLGPESLARLAPRQSHLPERAVAPRPPLEAAGTEAWPATAPRPVELLAAPEPVEAVAEVPDGPPVLLRWRGLSLRIARADGPERIGPEWWRQPGPPDAATRDYYRLEDADGRRLWVYRDGLFTAAAEPRWYLHGFFA